MSTAIHDHTLGVTITSEIHLEPVTAFDFFCEQRRCSWTPIDNEALITKAQFFRSHNGWVGNVEAIYEGTLQFYTIDVKPE